jgi:hypothetical protein
VKQRGSRYPFREPRCFESVTGHIANPDHNAGNDDEKTIRKMIRSAAVLVMVCAPWVMMMLLSWVVVREIVS